MKGFLRLKDVLELIPVKRSCWYAGVKSGKFPAPVKMGNMSFYRVEDIERTIREISEGAFSATE